ncbi:MAG: hypothetical protein LBL93_05035 [Ruminococcus sp.]|jgi:hypothetical protein|nr:hypothetical protein [Ruminococcus sp.]
MKNYWITQTSNLYLSEIGRTVGTIQVLQDELTDRFLRPSELIHTFNIPVGYLTPGSFYERVTDKGETYADIYELEIFNSYGEHLSSYNINGKFGLYASIFCMKDNNWI